MTLKEAYNYGVYFLSANGIDEADFKSLCLACSVAGIKNNEFYLHKNDEIIMKRFADLLWRVKSGEPLQYVIGKWDFYNYEFYVGSGVLIPRPETEELTKLVINYAKNIDFPIIYDLCAGCGCIGISVAREVPKSKVYCVEISDEAFFYLNKNSAFDNNVFPVKQDVNLFPKINETADIIVSNPPYIKTSELKNLQAEVGKEPVSALDGGESGLHFYYSISENWKYALKPGGKIFFEIGNEQGKDVENILSSNGFSDVKIIKDIYGNNRIVSAVKS
ncbi:MAG: peptide chain release factor N(5)-glutamine methyltransferase [Clostridiales bacterium]|nr:peptide chain release factor N(5)-glutamine methyltransferase [Clostridiales bacterium]